MFSALAGMYMAAKVHFTQTKANLTKNQDKQVSEMLYKNKVNKLMRKVLKFLINLALINLLT